MKYLFCIALLFAVFAIAGTGSAFGQKMHKCYVNDPTGTPLNLRSSPNGRVIQKLRNGTVLYIEDGPIGEDYAAVSRRRNGRYVAWGFVFFNYVTCPGWN